MEKHNLKPKSANRDHPVYKNNTVTAVMIKKPQKKKPLPRAKENDPVYLDRSVRVKNMYIPLPKKHSDAMSDEKYLPILQRDVERIKESIIVLCRKEKMFVKQRPEATVFPLIEEQVARLGEAKIKLWKLEQKMNLPRSFQKCPDMSYLKCYPV